MTHLEILLYYLFKNKVRLALVRATYNKLNSSIILNALSLSGHLTSWTLARKFVQLLEFGTKSLSL